MRGDELKAKFRRGDIALGIQIQSTDPELANILAHCGYDFVWIDNEHATFSPETLRAILSQFRDSPCVPMIRVAENRPILIQQALDFGAEGVLVPMIASADDAARAVQASRYPPAGIRGTGPRLATENYRKLDEYLATANDRAVVCALIETADGVRNMAEILAVPGVDLATIGTADLSMSLGLGSIQTGHPSVVAAIEKLVDLAPPRGVVASVSLPLTVTPEILGRWLDRGARAFSTSHDWLLLQHAANQMTRSLRTAISARPG